MTRSEPSNPAPFPTTVWTQVIAAGEGAHAALAALLDRYWRPVYSFLRRSGRSPHDAADLTQAFALAILDGDLLKRADQARGRFRSYLLTSLRHFLVNEHERAAAAKRGGGRRILSLDVEDAERALGVAKAEDPERAYHRQWASQVLDRVLARLRDQLSERAAEVFALAHGGENVSHAEIAARLGMTDGAVAASLLRTREKFKRIFEDEVRETVETPDDFAREFEDLLRALG